MQRSSRTVGVLPLAAVPGDAWLIPVKGVKPNRAAFRRGDYPFGLSLHLAYRTDRDPEVASLLAFLRSAGGRAYLAKRLSIGS